MKKGRLIISAVVSGLLTWFAWSLTTLASLFNPSATSGDFGSWFAAWLIFTVVFYQIAGLLSDLRELANKPRSEDKADDHNKPSDQR